MRAKANWTRLLLLCLLLVVVGLFFRFVDLPAIARPVFTQPVQQPDWRFGVVESYEDPAAATDLGVAWTRVRFHWAYVQAEGPGTWTPRISEERINDELAAARTVVGILIGIPDWARGPDRLPAGLWLPPDDPENTWANYVREAVGRYNGRINHWVIWNEPDIPDPTTPGHTWDGTITDFIQLQRVAYLVAKETNPDAVIHLAAFTHFWDPGYFDRFLAELVTDPAAANNNYYFDVATAHLYFQPNAIYNLIQAFYGAMANHGLWKPIWLMETNAPPLDDPTWPVPDWTLSVTLDEQAAFMPQALALALAAGAERIAIYKLKDTADDRAANPEPFGLLRADGSRRPAYHTYRVAIQHMSGVTAVYRERWNEVGQIRLDQTGQSTTVLFARLPAPQVAEVTATARTAQLVDMWGTSRRLTAADGLFRVELPPALCTQPIGDYCMIGGSTYYLVQDRPEAAAAVEDSAPVLPTPYPTVDQTAVAAVFPPTPVPTSIATQTITPSPSPAATVLPAATVTGEPTATGSAPHPILTDAPETAVAPSAASGWPSSYWLFSLAVLLGIGLFIVYRQAR